MVIFGDHRTRKLAFFVSHGTRWPGTSCVGPDLHHCGSDVAALVLLDVSAAFEFYEYFG